MGPNFYITDDELIADLQRVADELGHEPTIPEYEEHGEYGQATFYRRFESWDDATGRIDAKYNPDRGVGTSPEYDLERLNPEDLGLSPKGERR